MVTGKDVALIADVAREDSHTMITLDRKASFDIAQMKGIPSRFLFFPDESHFVLKPQNSILWQREFFRFLDEYLKK